MRAGTRRCDWRRGWDSIPTRLFRFCKLQIPHCHHSRGCHGCRGALHQIAPTARARSLSSSTCSVSVHSQWGNSILFLTSKPRPTRAFTESHQGASCSGKLSNRLLTKVFLCRSVSLSEIVFQACSFPHSSSVIDLHVRTGNAQSSKCYPWATRRVVNRPMPFVLTAGPPGCT